jgi:SAM-dependent methyltransferase
VDRDHKSYHEDNRHAWNAATDAHNSHKADQAAFLRQGGSTLFQEELDLLGNITGKSLLHLQCNSGQDSLSLARLGADVTGVDISDTAISFAQKLSIDSGIPATFVRMDVYDWLAEASARGVQFDVVFSSYGAIVWLSDLRMWAQGIHSVLKPGGQFVLVEFHPFSNIFDWDWSVRHPYFTHGQPSTWENGIGDYVALAGEALTPSGYIEGVQNFINPHRSHEFSWTMADVVTALITSGMMLTTLREYPYSNGAKLYDNMREGEGKRMYPPTHLPSLPLMFALSAQKPNLR